MHRRRVFIKWFARIFGGVAVAMLGFLVFGLPLQTDAPNLKNLYLLSGFTAMGYLFAWFREKEGGWVLLFSGTVLGLTLVYSGMMTSGLWLPITLVSLLMSGILFVNVSH